MTRSELLVRPPKGPTNVASPDTTFGGSRNGFSAIVLWNYIAQNPHKVQTETIARCMRIAESAAVKLDKVVRAHEQEGHVDLVTRTESSLSIVFPEPHDDIVEEFSLAQVTAAGAGGVGTVQKSHLFVMPHVDDELIDRLILRINEHTDPFPSTWIVWPLASPDAAEAMTAPAVVETVLHVDGPRILMNQETRPNCCGPGARANACRMSM